MSLKAKKKEITAACYAWAISRFLDLTGNQVHDVSSDTPKHMQEFNKFTFILHGIEIGGMVMINKTEGQHEHQKNGR